MITTQDIVSIIDKIPQQERAKWGKLTFVLDNNTVALTPKGLFIRGEYFNASREIYIYGVFINTLDDLKKVILHELTHHLGLDDKTMTEKGMYQ